MSIHKKLSTESRFLDLDVVQEYIKQDLDQNEYFRYEHDIDFDIPEQEEFFDCVDSIDEPPQIERFNQIKSHILTYDRRHIVEDEIPNPSPEQIQLSIESQEEEFQYQDEMYDVKQIEIDKRKVISIFTLKQDYFDNQHNAHLFLKNVELLRQKNIHLEEFYAYIKQLGLGCGISLDQFRYEMLNKFFAVLIDIIKSIDDMYRYQSHWLEKEPIITLQNLYQAFSFQWERFQDYTTALIDRSAISNKNFNLTESWQLRKGLEFQLSHLDEQHSDGIETNIQQSNLESLILFKIFELLRLNEHFIHIASQNQMSKRSKLIISRFKSRITLYKLLKNKVKLSNNNNRKRKSQVAFHITPTEKLFYLDHNTQIENIINFADTIPNRFKVHKFSKMGKNISQVYNNTSQYDYYQ